jgi:hypothetical protein
MSKYFHPRTNKVALHLASNLRPEDRREIQEGHGHNPSQVLFAAASTDYSWAFKMPNGEWGGAFGVGPDNGIWMLCTPVLSRKPTKFIRGAKRWLSEQHPRFDLLYNVVDQRNTFHHKLLKMLGFKTLRQVNLGPNFLPYLEIIRLCV